MAAEGRGGLRKQHELAGGMPSTLTAAAIKKWASPDPVGRYEEQKEPGSGRAQQYKLNTLIENCTQEDEEELHGRKQHLKRSQ